MTIRFEIEPSLQQYVDGVSIEGVFNKSLDNVAKIHDVDLDEASIKFGNLSTPLSKYTPTTRKVEIQLSPLLFSRRSYRGSEDMKYSLQYIISHELLETLMNKPSEVKHFVRETFNSFLPSINAPSFLRHNDNESLKLMVKGVCSDILTDKPLMKFDDCVAGFLIAHETAYYIDHLELTRNNITPQKIILLGLSSARRAIISSMIKSHFRRYRNYASKFSVQYHDKFFNKILRTTDKKKLMDDIYKELDSENPYWKDVFRASIDIGKLCGQQCA